jgi:hypothetical protein
MHPTSAVRSLVILVAVAAGCGRDSVMLQPDGSGTGRDASVQTQCDGRQVSFQHDVVPLIGHCGGEQCHGGIGMSWPYSSLVNKVTMQCGDGRVFVKPGDPANSYLLQKLEGTHMCMGARMPKAGSPLSAAAIQTIADWICEGAPNN